MILKNYFWAFKAAVPPRLCDDIIKHGLSQSEIKGKTGMGRKHKKRNLTKAQLEEIGRIRNSDIVWLRDPWIYKELQPYVNAANKNAGWNFQWDYSEDIQFTKYKLNQYYEWHADSWDRPYENPESYNYFGKIRKLSMTCQLTDGSEYEGGELEFDFRDYNPTLRDESYHKVQCKQILPKGSIIVFPSHVWHRVKPVTKGVRYSLVMWNLGYPFK